MNCRVYIGPPPVTQILWCATTCLIFHRYIRVSQVIYRTGFRVAQEPCHLLHYHPRYHSPRGANPLHLLSPVKLEADVMLYVLLCILLMFVFVTLINDLLTSIDCCTTQAIQQRHICMYSIDRIMIAHITYVLATDGI